jgi:surface polysaccharide O-acyltransferase-like enzyme
LITNKSISFPREKIEGFDYLRTVFCLVVVFVHLFPSGPGEHGSNHGENLTNALQYNFASLAVPVFLQISLFLFYKNRMSKGSDYLTKSRLPSLLKPYLLWTLAYAFINNTFSSFDLASPKYILLFLITGGYSIFYFFFSLLILTACAEMIIRLLHVKAFLTENSIGLYYLLFIISSVLTLVFQISPYKGFTEIWNTFNFMPYVFSSFIILHDFRQAPERPGLSKVKLSLLATAYLVFACAEWKYLPGLSSAGLWEGLLPPYTRLSLVFGAWTLTYAALLYAPQTSPIVRKISSCSLGIYCLHPFLTPIIESLVNQIWSLPGEELVVYSIVVFSAVELVSWLHKFKPLKAFV